MQRSPALDQLPPVHALALRLDALGADAELIAACLGIAPEAVTPLLEVAAAKLAHAERFLAGDARAEDEGSPVRSPEQPPARDASVPREPPTAGWEGKEEGQGLDLT